MSSDQHDLDVIPSLMGQLGSVNSQIYYLMIN